MINAIFYLKFGEQRYPAIKLQDNEQNQIVLNFLFSKQEHLTIHLSKDGTLLRTHSAQDKTLNTWDQYRVEAARALGYLNPVKHGKYYIHSIIGRTNNVFHSHLVSRRININDTPEDKVRYKKLKGFTLDVFSETVLLSLYLSTEPTEDISLYIPTSLGNIIIQIEE